MKILSRYIRYVGNEFDGMKPLSEELAHIDDYIEIQKIRYGGAFSYEADVADDLGGYQVPAMILQIFGATQRPSTSRMKQARKPATRIAWKDDALSRMNIGPGLRPWT